MMHTRYIVAKSVINDTFKKAGSNKIAAYKLREAAKKAGFEMPNGQWDASFRMAFSELIGENGFDRINDKYMLK